MTTISYLKIARFGFICTIWKTWKTPMEECLKPATLLKWHSYIGCFSRFLNCTNGTKSRNASLYFPSSFRTCNPECQNYYRYLESIVPGACAVTAFLVLLTIGKRKISTTRGKFSLSVTRLPQGQLLVFVDGTVSLICG